MTPDIPREIHTPDEIRKGDLIRYELSPHHPGFTRNRAREYVARFDGDADGYPSELGTCFLLDRPTPPVELPAAPTLGWVSTDDGAELDIWQLHPDDRIACVSLPEAPGIDGTLADEITAFTAATAVPNESLDALRHYMSGFSFTDEYRATPAQARIAAFLAAVDSANGTPS